MAKDEQKQRGVVKWFNGTKGYGFIQRSDGADVFVHFSHIDPEKKGYKSLNEGDEVEFDSVKTDKGWAARNVMVVAQA